MAEDRKLKLVLKDHDCARIGEVNPYESFDAVSRVNDVGEATLVAGYGASDRSDAVLDALDTPDVILEAYIQPPGHDTFLDEPAWAGFLRDRRVSQDGPSRTVTAVFKDYNHLLTRRVVKPPPGASHDEGYGCTPDVMRDLVRRQAAEDADEERQIAGLSVEENECDVGTGLYGDSSGMVFGSNEPEWVRANAVYEWGGCLYLGTETQPGSGDYAAIYRSCDGVTWTLVMNGAPDELYSYPITGVHSFCAFEGQLYAGCSQNWMADGGLVLRTANGTDWALSVVFPNQAGVWALCEFDSDLYAGTTGETDLGSETWLWRSPDGLVWASAATATAKLGAGCSSLLPGTEERVTCEAMYLWDDYLYLGVAYKHVHCLGAGFATCDWTYRGRVYRTDDGVTMTQVLQSGNVHGFLSFMEFGDYLYAGSGRTRFDDWFCYVSDVAYATGGRVWRSIDGAAWTQVFGQNLDDAHVSEAVTQMLVTANDVGVDVLWAASGTTAGGDARIYSSEDGETWFPVAYLTTLDYAFILDMVEFAAEYYATTGCYARAAGDGQYGGTWTADHGDAWRVVPSYADVAESGMMGRWTSLLDKLREIAEQSGRYDFRVVGLNSFLYCGNTQAFEFQVRSPQWGTDNTWDGEKGVTFSISRNNMASPEYAEVRAALPTFLYLLGPAAAEERTVEEFANDAAIEESPWGRIEGTADAQSIDSAQARSSIGWAELDLQGPYKTFDFRVLETDRGHFVP